MSAANGAEDFYSTEDHACRSEGVELALELDYKAAASWVGHPYFDVIDKLGLRESIESSPPRGVSDCGLVWEYGIDLM